jgi:hypothetical protein
VAEKEARELTDEDGAPLFSPRLPGDSVSLAMRKRRDNEPPAGERLFLQVRSEGGFCGSGTLVPPRSAERAAAG